MGFDFLLIPISAVEQQTVSHPPLPIPDRLRKAKALQKFRLQRDLWLSADLLGEPGWDMMLTAYIADLEGARSPATSICAGASAPPTTAIRWMKLLEKRGLFERELDPRDKRRAFIRLSEAGRQIMDKILDAAP